jgi:hypothetical protein
MLMALRVHAVQEEAKRAPASASLMPSWLSGDDDWKLTSIMEPTTMEDEEEGQVIRADDQMPESETGHPRVPSISEIAAAGEVTGRLTME